MIDTKKVEQIANEYLQCKEIYLVGVKVTKNNVITVIIDGDRAVVVEDCIALSRFIETKLDRNIEDYELTVTSFGLGEYFTMKRQYNKNIGENLEIVNLENEKIFGILKAVNEDNITIENKKKKEDIVINFDDIEKARVII